ncbi:MAG TPA: hypothetical protein VLK26_11130 [Rudaea sp.]|nr:hypothetical protein [Rudaea sp.]
MLAEAQRTAMLAAMGIAVYRLRAAPAASVPMRISVDPQACVCVDGGDGESAERLFALLPASLGVALERVCDAAAVDGAVEIDASCLRGDAGAKRMLWQTLKPLARRLREVG